MKTFVQVTDRINTIATNHRQINSVGRGDQWEIATSGVVNYPMFWAVPKSSVVKKGEIGYTFDLIVMDLVQTGEGNETDILSDTHQTLTDILSELKMGEYEDIDIKQEGFTAQQFTEKLNDMVSGWISEVTVWTPFKWDSCTIPTIT